MRTERQQQASRANGAKSRGPKTPEGKARSSQNSVIHGLLAKTVLIEGESASLFLALQAQLTDEFAPATPFESTLVDMMVSARWRSLRIQGLETSGIDDTVKSTPSPEELDESTRVSRALLNTDGGGEGKMRRYEAHYERLHTRAFNTLVKYRQLCGTIFADRPTRELDPCEPQAPAPPSPLQTEPSAAAATLQQAMKPAKFANWHKNRKKNRAQRRHEAANAKLRNEPNNQPDAAPDGQPAGPRNSQ